LRMYVCTECNTQVAVGGEAGGQYATIEELKAQGCPNCGSHTFRLIARRKALERDREGMFLAVDNYTGKAVGWLWVAINTNFLTEDKYANFRSLASAEGAEREVAEVLFARGIEYAR